MALKHSNPTRPRVDRERNQHWARAPYNFVPLPEKVVTFREPPDQDSYADNLMTGWIECDLETCSPTYVRGMLTEVQYKAFGQASSDALTPEQKEQRAPFFATGEEKIEGYPRPVIPGSTLRGMIRTLVEVVGYGRIRGVAATPTFTFRAVAASRDDPLREPYQEALGRFGSKVQAGYLFKKGEEWYVQPALTPRAKGWPDQTAYLKVKERQIGGKDITDFVRFDSSDYRPQWFRVSFNAEVRQSGRGRYTAMTRIGDRGAAGCPHHGILACSGNMLETGKKDQRSPRKSHALLLLEDQRAKPLKIRSQTVKGYLAGLTPFQQELKAWGDSQGCLKEGAPVFYVAEGQEVIYFGHSPNFRIPARLAVTGETRAATPLDFVPPDLRYTAAPDLADAIFGWVEERDDEGKVVGPEKQCAGRVFFGDAHYVKDRDGVWLKPEPITPHTLASPKPTTFQHYLVQDSKAGHSPDDKASLAHYGTPPTETEIRGHKFYWHKGPTPPLEATAKERQHENQLTRIVPLKPGVRFAFKIHFENLRPAELGALWWALALPGEPGQTYRHKLGMGKPLGMGAVALTPRLFLTDRQARYTSLFQGENWDEAVHEAEAESYLEAFENLLLLEWGIGRGKSRLAEVERIRALLAMLQWREGDAAWLDETRYMEIEREPGKVNEYKERPVLPDPPAVVARVSVNGRKAGPPPAQTRPAPPPERQPGLVAAPTGVTEQRGVVKHFNQERGFGFIQPDGGGPDVFVHKSRLTAGLQTLLPNQRVIFRVVKGTRGLDAQDVRLEK